MKNKEIKYLEHTADIKFQAIGKTLERAFKNAAVATFKAMYPEKIKSVKSYKIKVKGRDLESLLYNFLEELIVLMDSRGFFLSMVRSIKIDKKNFTLVSEIIGDHAKNYNIGLDVKAITYNEMFVKKGKFGWKVQVVLDV